MRIKVQASCLSAHSVYKNILLTPQLQGKNAVPTLVEKPSYKINTTHKQCPLALRPIPAVPKPSADYALYLYLLLSSTVSNKYLAPTDPLHLVTCTERFPLLSPHFSNFCSLIIQDRNQRIIAKL